MVSARKVTEQEALCKAQQFMQGKTFTVNHGARGVNSGVGTIRSLYVFNVEDNGGFVIVSGDDRTDAILGYATRGNINEGSLPPGLQVWMEQTVRGIEALGEYTASRGALRRTVPVHAAIQPLILTEWNQGNYGNDTNTDGVYNIHLPMIGSRYPCTGCAATAGAQLMYYYRWPEGMTQSVPGYSSQSLANTSADLPPIQFQWDRMKTRYELNDPHTEAVKAVADLMLYTGYAAMMNYEVSGSGASPYILANGMCSYFDYNPDTWKGVSREDYTVNEWDELIYNELAHSRPVICSGSSMANNGHVFLCDGYDGGGLYHFNWGWGGSGDGFFKLSCTGDYVFSNYCIIGLQPRSWPVDMDANADDSWELPQIDGIVATASQVEMQNMTATMNMSNNNEGTYGFGFGMAELAADGSLTILNTDYEYYDGVPLDRGYYFPNISFDFSGYMLGEGRHILVPVSRLSGETVWKRCHPADLYFEVMVKNGQKTIVAHPVESLRVNEFSLVSGGMVDVSQSVRLSITNEGDNLEKQLYVFAGTNADKGNPVGFVSVKIATGNTKEYRISVGRLSAGEHTLRLATDYEGKNVIAKLKVAVSVDLQVTHVDIIGKKYVGNSIQVDATVENHSGDYTIPLYMFASKTSTKKYVYVAGVAIERGGSDVINFFFRPDEAGTWNLWFSTDDEGVDVIGQTTVEIAEPYPANLSITEIVQNVPKGNIIMDEKITIRTTITNRGNYDYDDRISVVLFKNQPGTNYGSVVEQQWKDITLSPSATTTLDFDFLDLEDGAFYFWYVYYFSIKQSVRAAGGYLYQYEYTPVIPLIPGDANRDGTIDVADVVEIINYILGSHSEQFVAESSDLNDDGVIDIFDVTKLIGEMSSSGSRAAMSRSMVACDYGQELLWLKTEGNRVWLDTDLPERFTAFQFDVEVPEGIEVRGVAIPDWAGHHLKFTKVEDNIYRVIGVSLGNKPLPSSGRGVVELQLSDVVSGKLNVSDVLFVTPRGEKFHFADNSLDLSTGVDSLTTTTAENVYDMFGRRVSDKKYSLRRGLYIVDNKKVIVK